MEIVKIDSINPNKEIIKQAIKALKHGGVVMYPTDTAYGLAADIKNEKGIKKIFRIKGRMKNKTLPLIAGSIRTINECAAWTLLGRRLAKKYWPGPLTLILRIYPSANHSRSLLRYGTIARGGKIAIRVSDNKIARALSKSLGRPITSTSANKSENPECYSVADFLNQMAGEKALPDLILDAGRLPKRKASTIVDATGKDMEIMREGAVKLKN